VQIGDQPEPAHIEPSLFGKAFGLAGAFVAISALAGLTAFMLVTVNKWYRYQYSIFGLAWGLWARWLQFSVRWGIKGSLASPHLTTKKRKILGEQLEMLRVTRWFVRAELFASTIMLVVEIFFSG
jgi:hypothetical protein